MRRNISSQTLAEEYLILVLMLGTNYCKKSFKILKPKKLVNVKDLNGKLWENVFINIKL